MKDIHQGYSAGLRLLVKKHRLKMPAWVNTGLFSFPKKDFNLDFIENFLGQEAFSVFPNMIEQTCWAAMVNGKDAFFWDPSLIFCARPKVRLVEKPVAVHFIGSTKEQIGRYYGEAESESEDEPKCIGLVRAPNLGWRHIVVNAIQIRIRNFWWNWNTWRSKDG